MWCRIDMLGVAGIAVGRNVFQRSHDEAVSLLKALRSLPLFQS